MTRVIASVAAVIAGLAGSLLFMFSRNRRLKKEYRSQRFVAEEAARRADAVAGLSGEQQRIRRESDEAKRDLEGRSDGDLVDDANSLFD